MPRHSLNARPRVSCSLRGCAQGPPVAGAAGALTVLVGILTAAAKALWPDGPTAPVTTDPKTLIKTAGELVTAWEALKVVRADLRARMRDLDNRIVALYGPGGPEPSAECQAAVSELQQLVEDECVPLVKHWAALVLDMERVVARSGGHAEGFGSWGVHWWELDQLIPAVGQLDTLLHEAPEAVWEGLVQEYAALARHFELLGYEVAPDGTTEDFAFESRREEGERVRSFKGLAGRRERRAAREKKEAERKAEVGRRRRAKRGLPEPPPPPNDEEKAAFRDRQAAEAAKKAPEERAAALGKPKGPGGRPTKYPVGPAQARYRELNGGGGAAAAAEPGGEEDAEERRRRKGKQPVAEAAAEAQRRAAAAAAAAAGGKKKRKKPAAPRNRRGRRGDSSDEGEFDEESDDTGEEEEAPEGYEELSEGAEEEEEEEEEPQPQPQPQTPQGALGSPQPVAPAGARRPAAPPRPAGAVPSAPAAAAAAARAAQGSPPRPAEEAGASGGWRMRLRSANIKTPKRG